MTIRITNEEDHQSVYIEYTKDELSKGVTFQVKQNQTPYQFASLLRNVADTVEKFGGSYNGPG